MMSPMYVDERMLRRVRKRAPEIPLCRLLKRSAPEKAVSAAASAGFEMVAIAAPQLTAAHVSLARRHHLSIRAWGVENDEQLRQVIALGADGATVDHPDRAFAILRKR